MSRRSDKVRNTLKKALSEIIKINYDFEVLVSISEVDISPDLSQAKVYISILGDKDSKKSIEEHLNSNTGQIKNLISNYIKLRKIPSLIFLLDETIERAEKIQRLIDEANAPLTTD